MKILGTLTLLITWLCVLVIALVRTVNAVSLIFIAQIAAVWR